MLVWASTKNGRKQNSQTSTIYEFGNNKAERYTKRQDGKDEVREDGRLVGGKGWKKRVYNREEWKKLLRTARSCRILHVPE